MPVDDYNPDIARRDLKYYIFDWDDNILRMPTYIHLERRLRDGSWVPHLVSTALFSVIRNDTVNYRPPQGQWEKAFVEFRDPAERTESKFLADARTAIDRLLEGVEKQPPSFNTFRKILREGRIFAIVTARGHASETIRDAVRIFIDTVLTPDEREEMMTNLRGYRHCFDKVDRFGTDEEELDYFLSMCRYHAVTNPDFKERLAGDDDFGARVAEATSEQRPELAKEFAIRDFVEHLFRTLQRTNALGHQVAVGFSDDDAGNVAAVSDYIRSELARRFGGFKFVVYDTSDPSLSNGRKVTVAGQLTLPGF